MPEPSLLLAAIHNGELASSPARKVIEELCAAGEVNEVIEIYEQPRFDKNVDVSALITWREQQRSLESAWQRHLGHFSRARDVASLLNSYLYRARVKIWPNFREQQWIVRQVETFVSSKHTESWRHFLASGCATLVVLESDATATTETLSGIHEFLQAIPSQHPTYVNFAGGLTHETLNIQDLGQRTIAGAVSFARPVTNTSCAYALNRQLAAELMSFVDETPSSRTLGIDWLINAFFIRATDRREAIVCLHADPPVVRHGSLSGITRSWHPDR